MVFGAFSWIVALERGGQRGTLFFGRLKAVGYVGKGLLWQSKAAR